MKSTYSIREFGSLVGKATKTLQRWDREGTLKAYRSATNRRYYTHDQYLQVMRRDRVTERKRILYARVSSSSKKKDLLSQKKALEDFCVASGKTMDERLEDIGSGLNYNRKFFTLLMEKVERGEVSEIIIAHKDRLVRFGFEWFEKFCKDHGTAIIVMNAESLSPEAEMTKDLLSSNCK